MNAIHRLRTYPRPLHFASVPLQFGDPPRDLAQEHQDKQDEERRREAIRDLVESWMDRLQLISVITTFFASTEASMITVTAPTSDGVSLSLTAQFANIGIMGALVVHSSAAIISFMAAFFLIRYKLKIATSEERQTNGHVYEKEMVESPISDSPRFFASDMGKAHQDVTDNTKETHQPIHNDRNRDTDPRPGLIRVDVNSAAGSLRWPIYSTNPHLVQVGPFQRQPPIHLLGRCHTLCVILAALGFVLGLMGILCFAWDRLPLSVSVSSSFFMAMCVISWVFIFMKPYPGEGVLSGHIYYLGR